MAGSEPGALPPEVQEAMGRLDELIEAFESDPDEGIGEMAIEMLQSIDAIHRAGITRLATFLDEADPQVRERALADGTVRLLFEMYDLLPDDPGSFISLDELTGPARPL